MADINYRKLAIQILEEIPRMMGQTPHPWPMDEIRGKIMKDNWMVDELAKFLGNKLG